MTVAAPIKAASSIEQPKLHPRKSAWRTVSYVALSLSWLLVVFNLLPFVLTGLPLETWQLKKSDVIIMLGARANEDATPSSAMRVRIDTTVNLFKQGYAPYLIVTGRSPNRIEANIEAQLANEEGVPRDRIVREGDSWNTRQDAYESYQIMRAHGWKSAIIVSEPEHLLRANLIFSGYPINYCMYASPDRTDSTLWDRLCFDYREKYWVTIHMLLNKGVKVGLKPEQAAHMEELVQQAKIFHHQ